MATWEDVRALGLALEGAEEGTSYRMPALKVAGGTFATLSSREDGAVVLRCDPDERPLMLESRPEVFYLTPHYDPHGSWVLARLVAIDRDELAERLEDSYNLVRLRRPRPRHAAGAGTRSARRRRCPS